uniref:Uncharacterized protein n=1 Tax=Dictyoglomus thermophilum TaxID=14 RepID=A0A7C3RIS7_DICTH
MKFPIGKEIYIKTPAFLINIKELISWFRLEKFNGVLWGESSNFITEILIYNGVVPKAYTIRETEILAEDNASIEIFVNDFIARSNLISLYSLEKEIVLSILISYFSTPKIFQEETYLFVADKLVEEAKKENTISHILIESPSDKIHFLFSKGKFLGCYQERDGILKDELSISEFFENKENLLSFYQVREEEFERLNIPSLKFSFIEEDITSWTKKLLEYVNYVINYYTEFGMYIKNMESLLKNLKILEKSLICSNNNFTVKNEIMESYDEVEKEVVELIARINRELAGIWGEKFVKQKYMQAYKKFLEGNQNDKVIIELLDRLNPENIEF